jgi:hypothetical protein
MSQFSDNEGITTAGWQSDQFLAFARISLVYFGLSYDYCEEIEKNRIIAFQQVFVLWFMLLSALFTENKCNTRRVDDCVRLFLSACMYYGEKTIKCATNGTLKGKSKGKAAFFEDTSNYFSLLNFKNLIDRFSSIRLLWEGEREKFIKYVKKEMNTICNTDTYMPHVTNKLNEYLKTNQLHVDRDPSKTRGCKVYNDYNDLNNNFRDGIMLSGVIVKSSLEEKEDIFVCYKGNTKKSYVLHRLDFDDGISGTKIHLYYALIKLSNEVGKCFLMHFDSRELLLKAVSGFAVMHPMVTKDMKFRIKNGHTVLTKCWKVRTVDGIHDFLPTVSKFVFH